MVRGVRIGLGVLLAAVLAAGCGGGPSQEDLAGVRYAPSAAGDSVAEWPVSTPAEQGLDPDAVAELFWRAGRLGSLFGLLVVKDGHLVAEDYFHAGKLEQKALIQSATKSITGALVGIAIDQGCLPGTDALMMTYFPELADQLDDPRKNDITIAQLLAFRAGYAWEESSSELLELLYDGFPPPSLITVPLVRDPGTGWDYSNLSTHLLGIVVSRACGVDLLDFGREHLFGPLGMEPGPWAQDWEGYRWGPGELHLRARDMARFGQLYLDRGSWEGQRIVSQQWVTDSWQPYTENAWYSKVGDNFDRTAYGYQWWIIDAGPHTYYLAWGHGGQQIAVVPDLGMVVVATADPLVGDHGGSSWSWEKANLNLVADFIAALPQR